MALYYQGTYHTRANFDTDLCHHMASLGYNISNAIIFLKEASSQIMKSLRNQVTTVPDGTASNFITHLQFNKKAVQSHAMSPVYFVESMRENAMHKCSTIHIRGRCFASESPMISKMLYVVSYTCIYIGYWEHFMQPVPEIYCNTKSLCISLSKNNFINIIFIHSQQHFIDSRFKVLLA